MNKKELNSFSPETKMLWQDNYSCWECQRNNVCDYHHIVKRGTKHDDCESSPFNTAHLCRKCHEKGDIHSPEKQCKYLNKTINHLISIGYEPKNKDFRFLEKYKEKYKI
jgi:hypothetical protein